MKSYIKSGLFAVAAMASATIYYSCTKEDVPQQPTEYSKTIEVFDDCGLNSVVLELTSDDKSVVDMYSADNFQLIINPVPYDEPETDEDEDDDEFYSDDDAVSVSISVMEKNFVEDVHDYELERIQPEGFKNLRASWSKEYFPSRERGIEVTRTSINRRVYLTTKYGTGEKYTKSAIDKWTNGKWVDKLIKNKKSLKDKACDDYTFIAGIVRCKKQDRGKYYIHFYNATYECAHREEEEDDEES